MEQVTPTIAINSFVRRQNKESKFGYFAGAESELLNLVQNNFSKGSQGYREGVWLVPVPPRGFYTSIVSLHKDMELEARFEPRQEGEAPVLSVIAQMGVKPPAKSVVIVLYSHATLAENNEQDTDAEWEIISINPSPEEPGVAIPMHPITMARNMAELPGGTKATYTAEEYMHAILYWSDKVLSQ